MIGCTVPDDHPLTHADHAMVVFVVTDRNGDQCGVYLTPARALAYINDWLKDLDSSVANPEEIVGMEGDNGNSRRVFKTVEGDEHYAYDITATILRS